MSHPIPVFFVKEKMLPSRETGLFLTVIKPLSTAVDFDNSMKKPAFPGFSPKTRDYIINTMNATQNKTITNGRSP
jgi:hypothetical protein